MRGESPVRDDAGKEEAFPCHSATEKPAMPLIRVFERRGNAGAVHWMLCLLAGRRCGWRSGALLKKNGPALESRDYKVL